MATEQPTGMQRLQTPEERNMLREIETTALRSLPSNQPAPKEPYNIYEDIYMGDVDDELDNAIDAPDPYADIDSELEDDGLYDLEGDKDIYSQIGDMIDMDDQDPLALERSEMEQSNEVLDPEALWQPKSYAQFVEEKREKGTELDFFAANEESLMNSTIQGQISRMGWSWFNSKYATDEEKIELGLDSPSKLGYTQINGREMAIGVIDEKLKEMGNVPLTDYQGVRKAKELWDKKYELLYENQMDVMMAESGLPTVKEFLDVIQEDPESFFKAAVQEVLNKPELIFLPEVAAARGATAAAGAAKALGAGAKGIQVAKLAGAASGTYAGGVTLGTIDRVIEQSNNGTEIDAAKALEQAQVDGILGVVMLGGSRTMTKGLNKMSDLRVKQKKATEFAKEAAMSSEKDLEVVRRNSKIEQYMEDPATETYIDQGGNVYTFEIRETTDSAMLKQDVADMEKLRKKYSEDPVALEALEAEIKAKETMLYDLDMNSAAFTRTMEELQGLAEQKEGYDLPNNLASKWYLRGDKDVVRTENFMKFQDKDGVEHTLRRLTPEVLRKGQVNVQGVRGIDLTGEFNVGKANNKLAHAFKDLAVSATSSLRKLQEQSPTAKLLIDTVSPASGTKGRSPVYTIQENTAYHQGQYMVKSNELARKLEQYQGNGEEALRKHMRGVEVSEDPTIIEVAKGYRELLDSVRDYSKAKGMKVDNAKDYLPRYYNRKTLESPEAQERLADIIAQKYDREEALMSAKKIAMNIIEDSDEVQYLAADKTVNPVGFRKWKDIKDSDLDEFLDENFIGSIDRYVMNAVKRTETDTVFGYNGSKMDEWIKQINQESGRILEAREVDSIKDLYKLLNGTYGGKATAKGVTDSILALENALKLPAVTLTSALEPTTLLFKLNEATGIKGLVNAYGGMKARELFGDMSVDQIKREAQEVGLVHEVAVQERIEALTGEGLEGLPAKVNNKVMKAFMLHQWTEHTRTVAYEASRNDLLKTIKHLSRNPEDGKAGTRKRWLAENNIDHKLAVEWYQNGGDINDPFYTSLKRGAARMTNTAIANPNKINKAKILSSNRSVPRLVGQFKSFSSVFANEVVKPEFDEAIKLWNEGRRVNAMKKVGSIFGVVSAMTYWTTYDSSIYYGEGATGEDKPEEVATKMALGVAGMVAPGMALLSPVYGGRGLESGLGPAFSDANNIVQGNDPKLIAPTYVKTIEALNE